MQRDIWRRLRARLPSRVSGIQPGEGFQDLAAKLAHRIINLLALQMSRVVVQLGGQWLQRSARDPRTTISRSKLVVSFSARTVAGTPSNSADD